MRPEPAEGPVINWDNPFNGKGISTDFQHAATAEILPFLPSTPHFSVAPRRVDVTNPTDGEPDDGRYLVAVYVFPRDADRFPTDGRVMVMENATSLTAKHFAETVADPPGARGNYRLIVVGDQTGLLITNSERTIGRAELIRDGVMIDITGPALLPQVAEWLAGQV